MNSEEPSPGSPTPRAVSDDDILPIAGLNDLLFCERRCALHRIEQVWEDSRDTRTGILGHQRADRPGERTAAGTREVHGFWLRSERLIGKSLAMETVCFPSRPARESSPRKLESVRTSLAGPGYGAAQ
jgi:hypothetical protein